ncbi:hypothetical protein [Methylomicrobium lacus]|uniref:hypothetical protein n=1 Tax=Methylomicrobium lacus TaxID=136992 RepID=UPI0035A92DF7
MQQPRLQSMNQGKRQQQHRQRYFRQPVVCHRLRQQTIGKTTPASISYIRPTSRNLPKISSRTGWSRLCLERSFFEETGFSIVTV